MKIRNKIRVRKDRKKTKTMKRRKEKSCYASDEWSSTSGICKKCKWLEECGKTKHNFPGPKDIVTARCVA